MSDFDSRIADRFRDFYIWLRFLAMRKQKQQCWMDKLAIVQNDVFESELQIASQKNKVTKVN